MREKEGTWFCPKCSVYILGQNVTNTERHDNCGEPAEWHEWINDEMPRIPRWAYWLFFLAMMVATITAGIIAKKHQDERKQETQDQSTTETFSRISESQEIQEAYDRLYPLK